jgi:hypothetical protein
LERREKSSLPDHLCSEFQLISSLVDGRDRSWLMPCPIMMPNNNRVSVANSSGLDAAVSGLCQQFHNAYASVSEFIVSPKNVNLKNSITRTLIFLPLVVA